MNYLCLGKALKIVFYFFILGTFLFISEACAETWYDYYLQAEMAAKNKDWKITINLLKQAIGQEPKSEKRKKAYGLLYIDYYPYFKLGQAFHAIGDIESAVRYCLEERKQGVAPQKEIDACLTIKGNLLQSFPSLVKGYFGKSRSWAVIIGIADYSKEKNGFEPLPYAMRDAKTIRDFLVENLDFAEDHVFTLYNADATKANIEKLLGDELPKKLNKEDRLLFYFSGHGERKIITNEKQYGYLIPIDGNIKDIHSTCILMNQIGDYSDLIPAKQALFIIDACYSGIAGFISKGDKNELTEVLKAQERLYIDSYGRQIMTAGASGESVFMGGKQWDEHSVYTYYLLRGLSGEADYINDGIISTLELQLYLATKVSEDTKGKQNPQLHYLNLSEGQFIFYKEDD